MFFISIYLYIYTKNFSRRYFEENFGLYIDESGQALTFCFPLVTLSLVHRFTLYSHTLLLRSWPFYKHATLTFRWPWHLTLFFNNLSFCVSFWISVISLSFVNWFTSYSHTMLIRSPFHQHVALCPSDDLNIQHCFFNNLC